MVQQKLRDLWHRITIRFGLFLIRRLTIITIKYGNVRTVRDVAITLREFGEKTESKEWIDLADFIDREAEEIVLKRSKVWR